jgi:hypothetical protein
VGELADGLLGEHWWVVRIAGGALVGELADGLLGEHWWVVRIAGGALVGGEDCWGSIGGW